MGPGPWKWTQINQGQLGGSFGVRIGSNKGQYRGKRRRQKILFFSQSGLSISVLRVPEEKLAVHTFLG